MLESEGGCKKGFETRESMMEERVFMLFSVADRISSESRRGVFDILLPPLNLNNPIQQLHNLCHSTLGDEGVYPQDCLIS